VAQGRKDPPSINTYASAQLHFLVKKAARVQVTKQVIHAIFAPQNMRWHYYGNAGRFSFKKLSGKGYLWSDRQTNACNEKAFCFLSWLKLQKKQKKQTTNK